MNEEEKKAVEILNTFEFRRKTRNYKIISLEDSKSVKIVLNLLDKLQEENEEYSKQLDLDYVDKNYISKKKIEDTIEELKGKLEDISRRREKSKTKEEETVLWCLEIRTDERIKTLHELLENYKMNPKQ
jgi:predicted transcriptional regulator|nr:MAG TPA: hypothetical protein [Caudoviricetes sp.]